MKMSRLFGGTLRNVPGEFESHGTALLMRAGYIRRLGMGDYGFLPLGRRTLAKIETAIRRRLNALGAQEIRLPGAGTGNDLGRAVPGEALESKTKPPSGGQAGEWDGCIPLEETWWALVRDEIQSHRQLPVKLYQVERTWRRDARSRAGLLQTHEITMARCLSLDKDVTGLMRQQLEQLQACRDICHRCGLPVVVLASDGDATGSSGARELAYLAPVGTDKIMMCAACGYMAEAQTAQFRRPQPSPETPGPLEKVATPGVTSIEELARFLSIPPSRTAKAVFFVGTFRVSSQERKRFIFALVRGDMDVSEAKLAAMVGARALRPARQEEIRALGAEPGYASPIGVEGALVVADELIPRSPNLVAGANEVGYHLRNVNYGRDFVADMVGDIALAAESHACPLCGTQLRESRGVLLGHLRRGTQVPGASYLDEAGRSRPVVAAACELNVERILVSLVEEHHDERGIVWPITVAPYQVHIVDLTREGTVAREMSETLQRAGLEVLFDDRKERAGVKFNDADLIGVPIRITVGERGLKQGGVEIKSRHRQGPGALVALEDVLETVLEWISALEREVLSQNAEMTSSR